MPATDTRITSNPVVSAAFDRVYRTWFENTVRTFGQNAAELFFIAGLEARELVVEPIEIRSSFEFVRGRYEFIKNQTQV